MLCRLAFKTYLLSRLSEDELKEHELQQQSMRSHNKPGAKKAAAEAKADDGFVKVKIGDHRPAPAAAPSPMSAAAAASFSYPPSSSAGAAAPAARMPSVHDAWVELAVRDSASNKRLVLKKGKPALTAVPDQVPCALFRCRLLLG